MDDIVRRTVEAKGVWGARFPQVPYEPPDLDVDFSARAIALMTERAGGRLEILRGDLADVPERLALLVYATEDGLVLETRQLARTG